MIIRDKVIQAFQDVYGVDPRWITRSPGRVNIIGEHTDYNDGFVLPMSINLETWVALRPREDSQIQIKSLDMDQGLIFDLEDFSNKNHGWQEYIKGVAWALQEDGYELRGWEGVFAGDVPIGAGLSSSAALELALARGFALASNIEWNPVRFAQICQKAENRWVGVNSGIMDQLVSACGKENYALLIDCRSLETRLVPLPEKSRIVILDTTTRRGLVESEYNERRVQCEATACHFDVPALRDLSLENLEDRLGILNETLYRRARHVISANQRVLDAEQAMQNGDAGTLGELMNDSHASLRDDYEVSRMELDQIVSIAQAQPGCYGARLTGAGFGGCAIALVAEDKVDMFRSKVTRQYRDKTGLESKVYVSSAVDGTSFEEYGN